MVTPEIATEIISALPPDKVAEVRDFANFLKERYAVASAVEYNPVRTGEDMQDLTAAALHHADTSGGFLEWLEERVNPAELETALRQYLPDFSSRALTDPQQRIILNQRLAALGPLVLYELHQRITRNSTRLTPAEIVEKTWGTIKGIDQALLRQIIEDEDYLCAVALPTS